MKDFNKELDAIELPPIHITRGKEHYLDPFRERLILKTPEETVRQRFLRYLVDVLNVPQNMIQVEMLLLKYGVDSVQRADIIIERYDVKKKEISPLAVVECKAPEIMLGDDAITQALDYADKLLADYLIITNGTDLISAKYDEKTGKYFDLEKMPSYKEMLNGQVDLLHIEEPKERFTFDKLVENQDYYCGYEFNKDTPKKLRPFLTNLYECFLDTSHKMPERKYQIFTLIKDYGIRYLSCGNAAGGSYQGAYRSFLIKHEGYTKFMNLGFFDYGTSTIMTISIDQDNNKPHNSLQYSVNNNLKKNGEVYRFLHSGRIAVGNIGSGKVAELKELLEQKYPCIIIDGQIDLGIIHNEQLLYLDNLEVTSMVENALSYALIRDKYREIVKER